MKARYLTFFSYIGTRFRASEKLWVKPGSNYSDPESVQGMLELAATTLKPASYPRIQLSSRTDGGVHALNSCAVLELNRRGEAVYDPSYIIINLNKFLYKTNTTIHVKSCTQVSDTFSARYQAIARTYLYRLAILKPGVTLPEDHNITQYVPIEEWRRCHFLRNPGFDIDKFKQGANYFVGYHDFTTFKKFDKLKETKQNRRQIYSITVKPGRPAVTSYTIGQDSVFDYWDIEIRGRSFVHNQIRRMIGTLISVSLGKLPVEEIKVMLQIPSKHSWHTFIQNCPPDGLYLCNVEYDPKDLIYNPNSTNVSTREEDSDSE